MVETTKIGGPGGKFPATRWSAVRAARSEDSVERSLALGAITESYWKPIYKYFRLRWGKSNEDAKDLTQEFFARIIDKDFLEDFDPSKARLRTFLRVCADRFVSNDQKATRRLKRGGSATHISLDFDAAEAEVSRAAASSPNSRVPDDMDDFFQKEFVRSLFGLAVNDLREFCESRGKQIHFRLFELYDLEDGGAARSGYAELAQEFSLAPTDVTNYLAFARREFRRLVLDRLRQMTASDDEFRREARAMLGVAPE